MILKKKKENKFDSVNLSCGDVTGIRYSWNVAGKYLEECECLWRTHMSVHMNIHGVRGNSRFWIVGVCLTVLIQRTDP